MIDYEEMCNKVTALLGFSELLLAGRAFGDLTEKQKEPLREIIKAAEQLAEMIHNDRPPHPDGNGTRPITR